MKIIILILAVVGLVGCNEANNGNSFASPGTFFYKPDKNGEPDYKTLKYVKDGKQFECSGWIEIRYDK